MITKGRELIRISPKDSKLIEYSIDQGRSWHPRCHSDSYIGNFVDLSDNGSEIFAQTSKGLYYSRDTGHSWHKRS